MNAAPFFGRLCRGIALAALCLVVLSWSGPATAQITPGMVELNEGSFKLRRRGREGFYRDPGTQIPVRKGNVVQTGKASRATIIMREDHEEIFMYSNAHVRIGEFAPRKTRIDLSIGKALFRFLPLQILSELVVRTPTAAIGVKGTTFVVGADPDRSIVMVIE